MNKEIMDAKGVEELDRNFAVGEHFGRDDIRFFDVKKTPEYLFGLIFDEQFFYRMPKALAAAIGAEVTSLNRNTSGGRIRFRTNSPFVAISVKREKIGLLPHMALSGTSGFDLYVDGRFAGAFIPPSKDGVGYDRIINLDDGEAREREIMIHFPLYFRVENICVGVQEDATVSAPTPYTPSRPVVFYGSSITQGGCVSRPGLAYPAYVSRWLGCDYINLGFSGNAKGEPIMAEYIASLAPSVLVMDYDYNAPTYEHLAATHYAFYERFRALCPDTPVVMISSPSVRWHSEMYARRDLIRSHYEKAVKNGDAHVLFVDGETLMGGEDWDSCTVDGCHPNDLGHYFMAKGIAPAVREALAMVKA